MTAQEIKSLITQYTDEVWNRGAVSAMDRFYAPAYVHHDVSRPDVRTLDDYKQWANDLLAAFEDFEVAIDDLVAEDGPEAKAVKRWTASGTHRAPLAGIPATGKRVSFSGSSAYRVVDGRIVESWYVYDLLGLLGQLGMTVAPAPAMEPAAA